MSDEMKVKISEIKAKFIRKEAENVDKYGNKFDGYIDKEEGARLARILSGDLESKKNQKKLAKESDEVKAIFGLVSTPIEKTQASPVIADSSKSSDKVSKKAAKKAAKQAAKQAEVNKAKEAAKQAAAELTAKETSNKTFKTPFEEVKARFLAVMEYDEEKNTSNGTTAKEAYKAVKKEFQGKGKEYEEAISDLKDYAKHGFVNMRAQKTRASVQAYDQNLNLINADNLQYDTSKKVYKREKELTIANNNGKEDSWAKKAIRNKNTSAVNITARYLSGNMSQGKIDDRAVAAGNRAVDIRENKEFTKDDLVKALGKDNPLLQPYTDKQGRSYENVLVATDLITEANGKYRVKELSKVVSSAIGHDNTLNDHDNHNESEVQSVLTKLYQSMRASGSGEFKTSELKDSQVRDLIEFLGLEDDRAKLMVVRLWQNIWKDAGRGAVAGAAAGAANGSWYVDIKQHQEVSMPLEGFSDEEREAFINALKSENSLSGVKASVDYGNGVVESSIGEIMETAKGIYIAQDQLLKGDIVPLIKAIAVGAAAGAGTGAVLGALETIGSHAREKEVLGMVFDCDTTYEEIIDTIDNAYSDKHLSPEMKAALKEVAKLGIVTKVDPKTGVRKAVLDKDCNVQWDYCQFMESYNKARGNQIFNAAEVRAAARTADRNKTVIPDCNETKPEDKTYWGAEKTTNGELQKVKAPTTDKFEDWGVFASRYQCLEAVDPKFSLGKRGNVYSPNSYARTMMKVLQAVTDDDYDLTRLQALTEAAQRGDFAKLKSENGFNFNTYMALRGNKQTNTYGITKQNMPTITTNNGEQVDICAPTAPLYKAGKQSGGKGKNVNIQDAHNTRRTDGSYQGKLETSDGKKINTSSHSDYTNKAQELERQGYKLKTTK